MGRPGGRPVFGCGRGALVQCSEAAIGWSWCGVQSSQPGVLASSGRSPRAEPLTATCAEECGVVLLACFTTKVGQSGSMKKRMPARNPCHPARGVWRFYGSQLLRTASDFGYAPAVGSVKQYISLKSHLWDFPRTCPCPSEIRHYRAHRPLRRARRYPDRPPP